MKYINNSIRANMKSESSRRKFIQIAALGVAATFIFSFVSPVVAGNKLVNNDLDNKNTIHKSGQRIKDKSTQKEKSCWPYADETVAQRNDRMAWWRQSRFGMMICWGVYSVPAGTYKGKLSLSDTEWIMLRSKIPVAEYKEYAKQFNPVKYDPDSWVRLAKEAGMKYVVIIAKHHDGFAIFDTKVTDWDVVDATPYGKDLLKPLAEACRKHDMKLGIYYSQAQDWVHTGGGVVSWAGGKWDKAQEGSMDEYIDKIAVPQIRELLTNYGDVSVLWWDTPAGMNEQRINELQRMINLQPGIITNDRLGGDGDFTTPEQFIPATGLDSDWESCMTINNSWGYRSNDHNWKTTEELVRNLVDIASKGGNYILDVGPNAEGEIPQPAIERLKGIGQWMKINSESIYETTASPFYKLTWGRCTKKTFINGTTLYLHVFDWPQDGMLVLPGMKNTVQQAYLLRNLKKLKTTENEAGITVELPSMQHDTIDEVVVVKVAGKLDVELIVPTQNAEGVVELPAKMADIHNVFGTNARLEGEKGKENIGSWMSPEVWVEWSLEVKHGGLFEVCIEVATGMPETNLELVVGSSRLDAAIVSTGGDDQYKKVSLGKIEVPEAGVYSLRMKPVKKQEKPINLRSASLIPGK
jgi:alpha-L-fucosidase